MSNDRKMAYSRPDGTRADVPRPPPAQIMGYDKARPITGKMTYIPGPCPHRPGTRNKFSGLAQMFDESPEPQPFAGIVGDAAPAPMKPLQPLKPRQPTPFTKPEQPTMAYNSADLSEPSAQADLFDKMCKYLDNVGADEDDLRQFAEIWERVHKPKNQAMDSRHSARRAPRPMTAAEHEAYNRRFPDAARVRTVY
jgi:hypothetical protein